MAPSQLWDIVAKAANLVQLFGLDAATLVTVAMGFLQFHQVTKECWKLEARVLMLRVLLRSSPACWTIIQQQHLELGNMVTEGLEDAHNLIESYKESNLFTRVRTGKSMARQFRDARNIIDSYCGFILSIIAHLLIVQVNSNPSSLLRPEVNGRGLSSPSTAYFTDEETTRTVPHDTLINIVTQE